MRSVQYGSFRVESDRVGPAQPVCCIALWCAVGLCGLAGGGLVWSRVIWSRVEWAASLATPV